AGPLQLPDYNIRALTIRGLVAHFRREQFAVETKPVDLDANLLLARLQGGAALSFGGVELDLGGRKLAIGSLSVDAKSREDRLQVEVRGAASGLKLDANLALASVRQFVGLSGSANLQIDPEQLPPGFFPAPLAGTMTAKAELSGSPLTPRIDLK